MTITITSGQLQKKSECILKKLKEQGFRKCVNLDWYSSNYQKNINDLIFGWLIKKNLIKTTFKKNVALLLDKIYIRFSYSKTYP